MWVMDLNDVNGIANENATLSTFVLHWPLSMQWNDERFFEFCQANNACASSAAL